MAVTIEDIDQLQYHALRCAVASTSIQHMLNVCESTADDSAVRMFAIGIHGELSQWLEGFNKSRRVEVMAVVMEANHRRAEPVMPFLPNNNDEYWLAVNDAVESVVHGALGQISASARAAGITLNVVKQREAKRVKVFRNHLTSGMRRLAYTYPHSEALVERVKAECEAARNIIHESQAGPERHTAANGECYTPAALAEVLQISADKVATFAKEVGVKTPGRGKHHVPYSIHDIKKIVAAMTNKGPHEHRERAKVLLAELDAGPETRKSKPANRREIR